MKKFSTVVLGSLLMLTMACGGGNSIESQKASLAALKKQSLDLNVKIANLEKELEKAGGAEVVKATLARGFPAVRFRAKGG